MKPAYRILYLEDQAEDVELLDAALKREYLPCEVVWVNGRAAYLGALAGAWSLDLIFADYALPDISGEEALALARARCPEVPFLFLSGYLGEDKAVACLRNGAVDCLNKNNLARLAPVVLRALEVARAAKARREVEAANDRLRGLLRAILEATTEGLLVVDLAGRISTYNRKFLALCGIPDYVMAPMELEQVLQYLLEHGPEAGAFLAQAPGGDPGQDISGRLRAPGDRILEARARPYRQGAATVGRIFTLRESPAPGPGPSGNGELRSLLGEVEAAMARLRTPDPEASGDPLAGADQAIAALRARLGPRGPV